MRQTAINKTIRALALSFSAVVLTAVQISAQTTLCSDSFAGSHVNLNGLGVEGGTGAGTLWSGSATFFQDGVLNGTVEGSAILPFDPLLQHVYTLSLSVSNITDRWVGLGFNRDALLTPVADNANDRFSNEAEGISWMLFRDHATDATQDIQIFGGLRTANGIADNNTAITHAQWNALKIVIDTSADLTGASFLANFFLNGVSITTNGLPMTVNVNINDINFVGMTFDDSTTATVLVDDFRLTAVPVPEPASGLMLLMGFGSWLAARRAGRSLH